jgi:hypothetical protein
MRVECVVLETCNKIRLGVVSLTSGLSRGSFLRGVEGVWETGDGSEAGSGGAAYECRK